MNTPSPKRSWARWAFLDGMVGWGIMFALLTLGYKTWVEGEATTPRGFLILLATSMIGGIVWGSTMWWWERRSDPSPPVAP